MKPPRSTDNAAPADPEGLAPLVASYLEWMRATNYSDATVENQKTYLRFFLRWCADRDVARPADVTRPILE
jgi:site-specific recombinase XerD